MNIIKIIDRSAQGVTGPFICTADDGNDYYVKGSSAGFRSQICEWIGTKLAAELGLPVPPAKIAVVPTSLINAGFRDDVRDLGAGEWFASQRIPDVIEMPYNAIRHVPGKVRATLLLLDWWILNPDRTLGEQGGNPNLLWEPRQSQLHVIDHNNCFDPNTKDDFWIYHIFSNDSKIWDASFRTEFQTRLNQAQAKVAGWWNEMPESWYYDVPGIITCDEIIEILERHHSEEFWRSK